MKALLLLLLLIYYHYHSLILCLFQPIFIHSYLLCLVFIFKLTLFSFLDNLPNNILASPLIRWLKLLFGVTFCSSLEVIGLLSVVDWLDDNAVSDFWSMFFWFLYNWACDPGGEMSCPVLSVAIVPGVSLSVFSFVDCPPLVTNLFATVAVAAPAPPTPAVTPPNVSVFEAAFWLFSFFYCY